MIKNIIYLIVVVSFLPMFAYSYDTSAIQSRNLLLNRLINSNEASVIEDTDDMDLWIGYERIRGSKELQIVKIFTGTVELINTDVCEIVMTSRPGSQFRSESCYANIQCLKKNEFILHSYKNIKCEVF